MCISINTENEELRSNMLLMILTKQHIRFRLVSLSQTPEAKLSCSREQFGVNWGQKRRFAEGATGDTAIFQRKMY